MRYVLLVAFSMILALIATTAGAQEASEEALNSDDRGTRGTFHRVIAEYDQLVMDDEIYALQETVWVDGTKYPADRVEEILQKDDAIELILSGARRGGYQVVTRIRTNP